MWGNLWFVVCLYLKRVFVLAGDDSSSVLDDLCTSDATQLDWSSLELFLLMETTCWQQVFNISISSGDIRLVFCCVFVRFLAVKLKIRSEIWKKWPRLFHRSKSACSWWGQTVSPCSSAVTSSSSAANAWWAFPPIAARHSSWSRPHPQPIGGYGQNGASWSWAEERHAQVYIFPPEESSPQLYRVF